MSALKFARKMIAGTPLPGMVRKLKSSSYRQECAFAKGLSVDLESIGFGTLVKKHSGFNDSSKKYLDLSHLEEAVHEAGKLHLLNSPPLRILDIGCGAGYFLYALKRKGHDVLGIDLPDNPMYNDIIKLIEVSRVAHRVLKFQPLPDLGSKFDRITAFSICFDLHWREDVWGCNEWKYFLDDCSSRLNPGGRIFLNFNPASTRDFRFIPDEVAQMLRAMPGAHLSSSKEFFTLVRS
jgi:cyclopropane fatty-acyl-phospholipid synthase-like methyltransferase